MTKKEFGPGRSLASVARGVRGSSDSMLRALPAIRLKSRECISGRHQPATLCRGLRRCLIAPDSCEGMGAEFLNPPLGCRGFHCNHRKALRPDRGLDRRPHSQAAISCRSAEIYRIFISILYPYKFGEISGLVSQGLSYAWDRPEPAAIFSLRLGALLIAERNRGEAPLFINAALVTVWESHYDLESNTL